MRHIIDHQGVNAYLSGSVRNEVQDQISFESATQDRKLEQSRVMDKLAEQKKYPTSISQQQRARSEVLFGLATADEYLTKVAKEAQLRDYLLDHIHNQAEQRVKDSPLKFDYTQEN